jgi:hypothetical protein
MALFYKLVDCTEAWLAVGYSQILGRHAEFISASQDRLDRNLILSAFLDPEIEDS